MNNNRNNRRRGRGNRHNQGGANSQNRIDSRARGNAPQLLDKYNKLAQDAQYNGDRVQAEYYLQFADHYFRVIADNKARQEEARAKRAEERGQGNDDGEESEDGEGRRNDRRGGNRRSRGRRDEPESAENAEGEAGVEAEAADAEEEAPRPKRRGRKPRKAAADTDRGSGEIDSSVLPPSIGDEGASDGDDNLEAVG